MLETIKLIGAIAGLLTAAFVIWDRWARGRPLAWVTATKRFAGSLDDYICIKNPGHSDVFIRKVRVYPRRLYGVATGTSAKAIASSLYLSEGELNVLLRSGAEEYLPIIEFPENKPKDAPSRWVCFLISWRKTSSTWLPQLPIPIITSTHDIERITAAARKVDVQ
jgi:hypothetical protein